MSKPNLLLVDANDRNRRVLEVSLRKSGFLVTTSLDGRDALNRVHQGPPDIVVADTDLPKLDGFTLCSELKRRGEYATIPIILLSSEDLASERLRALELGADDFLFRPVFIKEIVARCRMLLDRRSRQLLTRKNPRAFRGHLSDMSVIDLLQMMELGARSGVIHLRGVYGKRGAIYFRDGKLIDAELGHLQGEASVFRFLLWTEASFDVEIKTIRRKDVILSSNEELLLQGMHRVEEWGRLLEQLPPLHTVFSFDYALLGERLGEIPVEVNSIIKLFDGRRTLMQVVDDGDYGDIEALEVISKLYFEGIIYDKKHEPTRETEPVHGKKSHSEKTPKSVSRARRHPPTDSYALDDAPQQTIKDAPQQTIKDVRSSSLSDASETTARAAVSTPQALENASSQLTAPADDATASAAVVTEEVSEHAPKEAEAEPPPKEAEAELPSKEAEAESPPKEAEAEPPFAEVSQDTSTETMTVAEAEPPPKEAEAESPPKEAEAELPPKEAEAE
ncbi:MAG: response regulator, partial [Deltaproteobacteria bacterium]|nr:response regulator [Deltaproteobacteria bacterium]